MEDSPAVRPSQWYYLLGVVVIATGVSLFLYTLLHGIFHITDNLTQVVVPGEKDLTLQPKLRYTIFLEEQSVVDGRIYSTTENLSGLTCHVNSLASGTKIELHHTSISSTYNVNGRSGRSVLEFVTQDGGTYHVACRYEEGTLGPETVVAVGAGFGGKLFSMLFICLGEMFGGGALGAAIILVTSSKRRDGNQRLAQQTPASR